MKPPFDDIDKDAVPWCLSWHADGRCDSFSREAILACAPPISGVYGLFNFDCQVFIGESDNIQEALLRHESENDFQSPHLRPTGFTFEPCSPEVRKAKAEDLIARYQPVLQTEAALGKSWSPSQSSEASDASLGGDKHEIHPDQQEFPPHELEDPPKDSRRFYLKRTRGATLAALFVMGAAVIFYLGMPTSKQAHEQEIDAGENPQVVTSTTQPPVSGEAGIPLTAQKMSSKDTAEELAKRSATPTPAMPNVLASTSTPKNTGQTSEKTAPAGNGADIQSPSQPAKTNSLTPLAESANLSKKWSVQIYAAPTKDVADNMVQRLKADGHDGYVAQATVKGKTYYRVRIGRFDARDEAESVRESFARQERYRDAYLTRD